MGFKKFLFKLSLINNGIKMNIKILISAIIGGVIATLLTGFISNTPPMWVGATHYGYPFAWLTRLVLAPEHFPWRVDVLHLTADMIVWAVIVGIVLFLLTRARKK